jgi:chemotaxis protein methyltransferase CheR
MSQEELNPPLLPAEFEQLRSIMYASVGIALQLGKEELIRTRLLKRLRHLQMGSFAKYIAFVQTPGGSSEFSTMVDLLTTNKTNFFREEAHFDFIKERVLPKHRNDRNPITIWSAGCSSGEEPYTLSMLLREAIPEPTFSKCRILATDLSTIVLAKAKAAVYDELQVADVPPDIQSKSFLPAPPQDGVRRLEVKQEVRKIVTFGRLNLNTNDAWPMKGPFDLIFCRNVMIYFDDPTRERLVARFAELLPVGGFLFIGHSESLSSLKTSLKYVRPAVYEKV